MPSVTPARGSEKVVPGRSSSGKGEVAESIRDASKWKKRVEALFHLDTLQEQASNHISSAMIALVQKTGFMKEVCIPCSPRAPWWILIGCNTPLFVGQIRPRFNALFWVN
jgi:hypothetical protein